MKHFKQIEFKHFILIVAYVLVFLFLCFILLINTDKVYNSVVNKSVRKELSSLDLRSKAVYIYDLAENRVLFEKNARTPLPLASITKLMSTHCALKSLDRDMDIVIPDSVYSYNDTASSTGETEVWKVKDLAIYTLITSSNIGTDLLSDYAGGEGKIIDCMNKEAQKMDLFETRFRNTTGLDIDNVTPGSLGSAENVQSMFQNIYFSDYDIISKTSLKDFNIYSKNGTIHYARNTNIVAEQIVGLLGSKTGLTDIAGGNLVFVMDVGLNHLIFVTILGSTEEGRFVDALSISNVIIKSFRTRQ